MHAIGVSLLFWFVLFCFVLLFLPLCQIKLVTIEFIKERKEKEQSLLLPVSFVIYPLSHIVIFLYQIKQSVRTMTLVAINYYNVMGL